MLTGLMAYDNYDYGRRLSDYWAMLSLLSDVQNVKQKVKSLRKPEICIDKNKSEMMYCASLYIKPLKS